MLQKVLALLAGMVILLTSLPMEAKSRRPARSGRQKHVKAMVHKRAKKPSVRFKRKGRVVRASQRFVIPKLGDKLVLASAAALVIDQRTGETLVQKASEVVQPIASITKLMTAMVVLDARQDLNEKIQVTFEDVDTMRHSRSRLPVGTWFSRQEALELALLASENRAAHALGRSYPGGLDACIAAMNAKAQSLGLYDTRFADPTGLSERNISSPKDLAQMVNSACQYAEIKEFSTRPETTLNQSRRPIQFCNTNALVRNSDWQIGLSKTGFINEAGRCVVMQALVANRPMLIVLLDSFGSSARTQDALRIKRWLEAKLN